MNDRVVLVIDGTYFTESNRIPTREQPRRQGAPAVPSRYIQRWEWLDAELPPLLARAHVIVVYGTCNKCEHTAYHRPPAETIYCDGTADDRIAHVVGGHVPAGDTVCVVCGDHLRARCRALGVTGDNIVSRENIIGNLRALSGRSKQKRKYAEQFFARFLSRSDATHQARHDD